MPCHSWITTTAPTLLASSRLRELAAARRRSRLELDVLAHPRLLSGRREYTARAARATHGRSGPLHSWRLDCRGGGRLDAEATLPVRPGQCIPRGPAGRYGRVANRPRGRRRPPRGAPAHADAPALLAAIRQATDGHRGADDRPRRCRRGRRRIRRAAPRRPRRAQRAGAPARRRSLPRALRPVLHRSPRRQPRKTRRPGGRPLSRRARRRPRRRAPDAPSSRSPASWPSRRGACFVAARGGHWKELPHLAERAGADAVPIVLVINFLIGFVLAYMGARALVMFGANIYVADLVGIGMTRQLGPLMTAIIVCGRSGRGVRDGARLDEGRPGDRRAPDARSRALRLAGDAASPLARARAARADAPRRHRRDVRRPRRRR